MTDTALITTRPGVLDERRAILESQHGCRASYGAIVKQYMRRAYAAAFSLTGNREDALDAAQQAFVKAWKAIGRFDLGRPFYPWLHRILRNLCFDLLRRRRVRPRPGFTGDVPDDRSGPEARARREELKEEVRRALGRLGERDREVLVLRHFHHLSYREIAESLGIPQGTVMSRLFTARKRMKRELADRIGAEA